MPKRKHKSEDDLEYLRRKVRKLERKMRKAHRSQSDSQDQLSRTNCGNDSVEREVQDEVFECESRSPTPIWTPELGRSEQIDEDLVTASKNITTLDLPSTSEKELRPEPIEVSEPAITEPSTEEPDKDLLEILGSDPSATTVYGPNIHNEVASRIQHIVTSGLTKESRKELNEKYLVPANCVKINAPALNPEIKAALTEIVVKRDKGIESRQKQLACAISGLTNIITKELEVKDKDNIRLKQLMDVCRILGDIQHAESVTRRNFAIFSIKKELKEHLVNTKIDTTLFGENLAETLKSAKAVTRSGTELKNKPSPKPKPLAPNNNLNWKSPAPARKQQSAYRGREAAPPPPAPGPAARYARSATHANSSKTSQQPSKYNRRR